MKGKASDLVKAHTVHDAQDIIDLLREKIKPENSDIVLGRFLALRADRGSLQQFQEKAEILAEKLRKAYIGEGMSMQLAQKTAVKKTIEMCRFSAKSMLVRSVLASTHFEEPKEVLAKFVTESNAESVESQILSFQRMNIRGRPNNRGNVNNARGRTQNFGQRNYGEQRNFSNNYGQSRNFQGGYRQQNMNNQYGRGHGNGRYGNNPRGNYQRNQQQNGNDGNNDRRVRCVNSDAQENSDAPTQERGVTIRQIHRI